MSRLRMSEVLPSSQRKIQPHLNKLVKNKGIMAFFPGTSGLIITPSRLLDLTKNGLLNLKYSGLFNSLEGSNWRKNWEHFTEVFDILGRSGLNLKDMPEFAVSVYLCLKWIHYRACRELNSDGVLLQKIMEKSEEFIERVNEAGIKGFGENELLEDYINLCLDSTQAGIKYNYPTLVKYLFKMLEVGGDLLEEKRAEIIEALEMTADFYLKSEKMKDSKSLYAALVNLYNLFDYGFLSEKFYSLIVEGAGRIIELGEISDGLALAYQLWLHFETELSRNPCDISAFAQTRLRQLIIDRFGGGDKASAIATFSDSGLIASKMDEEDLIAYRDMVLSLVLGMDAAWSSTADEFVKGGEFGAAKAICLQIKEREGGKADKRLMLLDINVRLADIIWAEGDARKAGKNLRTLRKELKKMLGDDFEENAIVKAVDKRLKDIEKSLNAEAAIKRGDFVSAYFIYAELCRDRRFLVSRLSQIEDNILKQMTELSHADQKGSILKFMGLLGNPFVNEFVGKNLLQNELLRQKFFYYFKTKFNDCVRPRTKKDSQEMVDDVFKEDAFVGVMNIVMNSLQLGRQYEDSVLENLRDVFQSFIREEEITPPEKYKKVRQFTNCTRLPVLVASFLYLDREIDKLPFEMNKLRLQNWFLEKFIPMFGSLFERVKGFEEKIREKKKLDYGDWRIAAQLLEFLDSFLIISNDYLTRANIEAPYDIFRFYRAYSEEGSSTMWENLAETIVFSLANICFKQQKYDEAEKYAEEVLSGSLSNVGEKIKRLAKEILCMIYLVKGRDYWKDKNPDKLESLKKAKELYEKEILEDPNDYVAMTNLGGVYFEMGDFGMAFEMCEQALAINGDFRFANLNAIDSLIKLEEFDKARQRLEILFEKEDNAEDPCLYVFLLFLAFEGGSEYVQGILCKLLPKYAGLLKEAIREFELAEGHEAPKDIKFLAEREP